VRRPLTLDELHEAVSVEPGQESFRHDRLANGFKAHMVSWCGNLVTVDEETRAVQFAHPTVKEYLLDHNADDTVAAPAAVNRFHFRPDDADIVVGEVCVTYLCFSDFERQLVKTSKLDLSVKPAALASASLSASGISSVAKGLAQLERWRNGSRPAKLDNLVHLENARRIDRMAARQDKFHFLPYATECWVAHTRYITENARTWRQFLRLVLTDSHFASLWSLLQAGNDMKRLVHDITEYCHGALLSSIYRFRPQFVAGQLDDLFRACCERRLPDLAMICLDIAEEVKVVHDEWLLFTAKWNAPQLTKRLLSMGVQVGTRGQDPNGALLLAVQGGHVDVFRELLAAGRYSYEDLGGKHVAENQVDRLDFKIVEMLLDAGSTFDALPAPDLKLAVAREAATSGQLELVEKLIGAGAYASGDERRPDGSTLLIAAIADRRFQLADNLIHMGASVNLSAYGDGQTALHVAVDVENAGTVQSLISMGAYVDAVSRKPGEPSALHTAVYRGNVEIVDLLLDAEAEINAWTTATLPPAALERFAAAGRLDLVEEFVVAGARIPINETPCNGSPLLVAAIEGRQFQLAGHLIDIGAHVNIEASDHGGRTPIQVAASTGSIEIVRRLLEAGANVNSEPAKYGGRTALQAAVEAGHLATVRLLLRSGADVNASPAFHDGKTAIEAAIASRNLFLVETLMLAGAPLSKDEAWHSGWTLLQAAAKACRVKLIQRLLLLGADVNARPADDAGQTALQAAASAGDRETVKLLLDAGANVNAPPAEYGGLTALQAAAAAGDMGTVELLLNAGAHVNGLPANPRGRTALQAAAEAGQREVAELLLAVGADVNASAANCGGLTALQAAAESGQQNIVELLLHAGADVNAAPAEFAGSTALEAAVQAGHEEVVRLLLDAVRQM
jgi:ankyrin repeat protein